MTRTIRAARPDDIPDIIRLLADDPLGRDRDDPDAAYSDPGYRHAFDEITDNPNVDLLVMEEAGRILATVQVMILPGLASRGARHAMIESLRVDSDLRGHGIGADVMEYVVAMCRKRDCASLHLKVHNQRVAAHRFYEKLGFTAAHQSMTLAL